ncbi:uncharacterized protein K452DRAFT_224900 [Aplosporella prunicola CBS 121167]|uniref:tripeptidyl-peptidase II n=1 Tax=Aplosporella prunicola CBS 121167 TaxID=1176127 RepID=A0A6A6BHB2_9PEZI|nr:uncharacterized protein K452DRAFT_224900 [Aplosporella prunicola CBS 121167]KAF2143520.1 hypothetical protein K452DRAFT_224900 [Aplosporella prunicola CBS 121167]
MVRVRDIVHVALAALAQNTNALSLPTTTKHGQLVEHETTAKLPAGWSLAAPAQDSERLNLRIALRQPHQDYLQIAHDVSDPSSPSYGKHLSASQLQAALPDVKGAAAAVTAWLKAQGVAHVSVEGEWVKFDTTVGQARDLFHADYARYRFQQGKAVLRTKAYSVPKALADDIDFLFPATHFVGGNVRVETTPQQLQRRQHSMPKPPSCDYDNCPAGLKAKYHITHTPPDAKSGSRLAVAGFLEEWPSLDDLHTFLEAHGDTANTTVPDFKVELVNGGENPNTSAKAGIEAMLDIDYTVPFTGPLEVTYISTGGRPEAQSQPGNNIIPASESGNEPYLEFLEYLLAKEDPPQVVSISYTDDEQSVPKAYAQKVCDLFGRLAARGVSVINASGDGGAAGTQNTDCPWVTSVGALRLSGGAASYSGGGYSNYFAVPAWQEAAVKASIDALKGAHDGYYNKTGRGIPDVALQGDDFLIVANGYELVQKGTSASAPLFAAMITLLNDLRLRAGKPVLGFLNPLLYAEGSAKVFRDVTDGFTSGCSNSSWFEAGWDSLPGWDAATGLGEPDFAKMRELVL